ncbi:MAG: phage integrase N-terminal SAM-like domain-containing protein [Gallionellaceae bacterium]|nr:phage integrase N-terminal SAM-like domain-containing protein [Gallionellaceae bacterium]
MVTATDISSPPKLLDQVVARLRVQHYSLRTEKTYVDWIKRYIQFHGKCHPHSCHPHSSHPYIFFRPHTRCTLTSTSST